jgi:hypothetical protein
MGKRSSGPCFGCSSAEEQAMFTGQSPASRKVQNMSTDHDSFGFFLPSSLYLLSNLFYRWENVRLDLYIFEYLFINKIFEMKNISLNDIYFF